MAIAPSALVEWPDKPAGPPHVPLQPHVMRRRTRTAPVPKVVAMTVLRKSTETIDDVRARLCARFPGRRAEVARQIEVAIACAEHLGVPVTPELVDGLVTEHLRARLASRPSSAFRASPAVPTLNGR
jgi:hypothetical protein